MLLARADSRRMRRALHIAGALCVLAIAGGTTSVSVSPVARPQTITADGPLPGPPGWHLDLIRVREAWKLLPAGSAGPLVAVIDSGVSPTNDLGARLVAGSSWVGGDSLTDDAGHGTAVAGIIAGGVDDGAGVDGVCPTCRILSLRVITASQGASPASVREAIQYAAGQGAAVINLSLGGPGFADLSAAVSAATAAGAVVVAAAGNDGTAQPMFPAATPSVLSVAAVDSAGVLASWSNRGDWVNVAAPGCTPLGSLIFCGTSASAPLVSGVAALARQVAPGASAADVVSALVTTAKPVAGIRYGLIDAEQALRKLGAAGSVDDSAGTRTTQPLPTAPTPTTEPFRKVTPIVVSPLPPRIRQEISVEIGAWNKPLRELRTTFAICAKTCKTVSRRTTLVIKPAWQRKTLRVQVTAVSEAGETLVSTRTARIR